MGVLLVLLAAEAVLAVIVSRYLHRRNEPETLPLLAAGEGKASVKWLLPKNGQCGVVKLKMIVEGHVLYDFAVDAHSYFEIVEHMKTMADTICQDYADNGLECPRS